MESRRPHLEFRNLNDNDWPYVKKYLHLKWVEDTCGIVGVCSGKVLGIAVYDNWSDTGVHMHHLLVEPWICTMGWLEEIFRFPFSYPHIKNIWGFVPSDNVKALRANEYVGFEEVSQINEYWYPDKDNIVMQMTRETCQYLGD